MYAIRRTRSYPLALGILLLLASCLESPTYQAQHSIPKNAWAYAHKPSFSFDITDTAARYHAYFLIRHTDAYPFSNIWVWVETQQPGDSTFNRVRVEVPLADRQGNWLARGDNGLAMGSSTGAIWEHRMPLSRGDAPVIFPKAGRYTIRFEQAMRTNPLPEVLQVGLRIEKK